VPSLALVLVAAGGLGACGATLSPRERYVGALTLQLDGDSAAAYDALIALAHDAPDTRAGRRARAILTGGSLLANVAAVVTLGSALAPGVGGFGLESRQAEARVALRELAKAEHAYFAAHNRYCVSAEECAWEPPRRSAYLYFFDRHDGVGGIGASDPSILRLKAAAALDAINLVPAVSQGTFLVLAIGDPDEDGELDLWSIDEEENLVHLVKDETR